MSKAKPTSVTFLLDRSGSMESIKDDTIGAFNAYLSGLQGAKSITFSLVQFDSQGLDKVCVRVDPSQAPKLDKDNFRPRASTPLIDACYKTIKAVEDSLGEDKKTQVVICIQTDGHENCSSEYTWEQLNALIKEKTTLGWQFNFMGAGIDAYDQGARMGISASATMSYNAQDSAATRAAFVGRAQSHSFYASGLTSNTNISDFEKQAAGDAFMGKTTPAPQVAVTFKKPAARKPSVDDFKL